MSRIIGSSSQVILTPAFAGGGPAPAGPTAPTPPPDQLALSGQAPAPALTAEEKALIAQGLLPTNFADLQAAFAQGGVNAVRAIMAPGAKGPFTPGFGDPNAMLGVARNLAKYPQFAELARTLRPGDLIVETWNDHSDPIANITKGPYDHVLLCTASGPPAQFIEAVGLTGSSNDPATDRVRRSTSSELLGGDLSHLSLRLIRPTEGLPPDQASRAVARAIAYAEAQLGKPYDYAFAPFDTASRIAPKAFYCSDLGYLAYASPQGAGLNLQVPKSAGRDAMMSAITAVTHSLQPYDQRQLVEDAFKLLQQHPTEEQRLNFLVDRILPGCGLTASLANTPEKQQLLKALIGQLASGQGFEQTEAASARMANDRASGAFGGLFGWFREARDQAGVADAAVRDVAALQAKSGSSAFQEVGAAVDIVKAVLPYSATFATFVYGPDDGRTKRVTGIMNTLASIRDARIPVIGPLLLRHLPGPAPKEVDGGFVSPSDLAWAAVPHRDYGISPLRPGDHPAGPGPTMPVPSSDQPAGPDGTIPDPPPAAATPAPASPTDPATATAAGRSPA